MNEPTPSEKKRPLVRSSQQGSDDEDEQVLKTMRFFDSMLDEYLTDQDKNENHPQAASAVIRKSPVKSTSNRAVRRTKHDAEATRIDVDPSSPKRPVQYSLHPPARSPFQQISSNIRPPYVRHYTSESNLNHIHLSPALPSKNSKLHEKYHRSSTAVSTDDLAAPKQQQFSSQANRSSLLDGRHALASTGTSSSLIDLTAISKLPSRPLFRFVPSSNRNPQIQEEPEIEAKQNQFQMKVIPSNPTPTQPMKYSHPIVKPIVIIPSAATSPPVTAPLSRLTETNLHHQNGNSAFKPPVVSSKSHSKPMESIEKAGVYVGLTNPSASNSVFYRQQPIKPQYHQSMMDLSSIPTSDSRLSFQPSSSNLTRHPQYVLQPNEMTRPYRYQPPSAPVSARSPPPKWAQQGRQPVRPFGSYLSNGSSKSVQSCASPSSFSARLLTGDEPSGSSVPAASVLSTLTADDRPVRSSLVGKHLPFQREQFSTGNDRRFDSYRRLIFVSLFRTPPKSDNRSLSVTIFLRRTSEACD